MTSLKHTCRHFIAFNRPRTGTVTDGESAID